MENDPAALREFEDEEDKLEIRMARAMRWLAADPPFQPVGHYEGVYYVLDFSNQLRGFIARDLTRNNISSLCGTEQIWLLRNYPRARLKGKGAPDSFRPEAVADAIMSACSVLGVWDARHRVRGRGTWLGEDNTLITHLGDTLMINGRKVPCSRRGELVYPVRDRLSPPARAAQPDGAQGPGFKLDQRLQRWQFRRGKLDRRLLVGWIAQSFVCGAMAWRSHCWLTGERGTGKTALLQLVSLLHGTTGLISVSDTSNAGLWQALGYDALPCLIDELENDPDDGPFKIVKLLRQASSGGLVLRGGADHRAREFIVRSAFLCACILMPPMQAQDRSRNVQIDVLPVEAPTVMSVSGLQDLGRQIFKRILDHWPRLLQHVLPTWREALLNAGWDLRGADLYGGLLACADVLLHDQTADDDLAEMVAALEEARLAHRADESPEWRRCLDYLLGALVDPYRKGERQQVGVLILRAAGYGDGSMVQEAGVRDPALRSENESLEHADELDARHAHNALGAIGLRVHCYRDSAIRRWLIIAQNHQGLMEIFKGSPWQSIPGAPGAWRQALLRTPDAVPLPKATKFRGVSCRGIRIPLDAALAGLIGEEHPQVVDTWRARWRPDEPSSGILH